MSKGIFGSFKDKVTRSTSFKSASSKNPFFSFSKSTETGSTTPADTPAEAPPAYSANAPVNHASSGRSNLRPTSAQRRGRSPSPAPSMASITNDDDKYAFLATFDTIFIVDDSGSMAGSNWDEVRRVLHGITPTCTARDRDGIDLYFLNHHSTKRGGQGRADGGYYNIRDPRTVNSIFEDVRPSYQTPTGKRLQSILKPYVADLAKASDIDDVKPVNIIIITDGCPTDDPESVIVQYARRLDGLDAPLHQVGIQFFQVGNNSGAREALRELDDDLVSQGIRDMVDASTWDTNGGVLTADGILKVVLGAVVRKIDRRRTSGDRRTRS